MEGGGIGKAPDRALRKKGGDLRKKKIEKKGHICRVGMDDMNGHIERACMGDIQHLTTLLQ